MLERERPLRRGAVERRDARGELATRSTPRRSARDPLELLVGHRRVPRAHLLEVGRGRRREVDQLEQPVHRVADLGRGEARPSPGRAAGRRLAHARDALGVVAVRAALEERERGVRELPHARGAAAPGPARAPAAGSGARPAPSGSAAKSASCPAPRRRRSLGLASSAAPASGASGRPERGAARRRARARPAPPRPGELRPRRRAAPSTQPIGVASSALLEVDRAGHDQPVDRARHRDVVEAQPLGALLGLARGRAPPRSRTRRARPLVPGRRP